VTGRLDVAKYGQEIFGVQAWHVDVEKEHREAPARYHGRHLGCCRAGFHLMSFARQALGRAVEKVFVVIDNQDF
jgi:hypothetical protein